MSAKKSAAGSQRVTTLVDPSELKPTLKCIGGSQSDQWNNILANQTLNTLWVAHSDVEARDRQYGATVAALAGIWPKDEIEGMIAAQLLAAHNAAMECYRRAMLSEQTFEGRRENLNQASKLSLTYATLLEALEPLSWQGPAEGYGRARPCARWRSGCRRHGRNPGGRGSGEIRGSTPCKANYRCTSAHDVGRGREAGASAARQRCRTVDAGCTAESHRALRRVIATRGSMATTRQRLSPCEG